MTTLIHIITGVIKKAAGEVSMPEEHVAEVLTHFGEILRHDMTVFFQHRNEIGDNKFPLKIIGWVARRFFLTTCPYENGRRVKLESGIHHNIVYLSKGRVYGFKSLLYREIQAMYPLLMFGYPSEVECVELRKEPRYKTFFAADIGSETDGLLELYKGTILNLSKSGCLVKLNHNTALNVGQSVNISFDMPTDNRQYNLTSIIRQVRRGTEKEDLGIEFQNASEEFKSQIDVVASVAEEAL